MWDDDDLSNRTRRGDRGNTTTAEPPHNNGAPPPFDVGGLPHTFDVPPDASDRVLMETARVVMGMETLLEIKVGELSDAVRTLAQTEAKVAGEMRERLSEGASRLDRNQAILERAQHALENHTAPLDELAATIASLNEVVASLSSIKGAIATTESQLNEAAKARHDALLASGKARHDEMVLRFHDTKSVITATQKALATGQEATDSNVSRLTAGIPNKIDAAEKSVKDQVKREAEETRKCVTSQAVASGGQATKNFDAVVEKIESSQKIVTTKIESSEKAVAKKASEYQQSLISEIRKLQQKESENFAALQNQQKINFAQLFSVVFVGLLVLCINRFDLDHLFSIRVATFLGMSGILILVLRVGRGTK